MQESPSAGAPTRAAEDFSIIQGGPMMRLMARLGLENPGKRVAAFVLVTWVPLLALSALATLSGGDELWRFLTDLPAFVRFLVAAPILVFAERRVQRFTSQVARQFVVSGLVRQPDRGRFVDALEEIARGRDSKIAEGVIVALAYAAAWIWFRNETQDGSAGWHARSDAGGLHFLPAGICYVLVSIPIYQFLIYRWVYRMLLWLRFLWRMSRLPLDLQATHPDQAAGLGFLDVAQASFAPIVFASAAVTSAVEGQKILQHVTTFDSIQWTILALVVVVYPMLVLGPLVIFAPLLSRARREAELECSAIAMRYARYFHETWGPEKGADESRLGEDAQSLEAIQTALAAAQRTRIVPVTRNGAVTLVLAGALPFVPLVLTKIPLQTILKMLFKVAA